MDRKKLLAEIKRVKKAINETESPYLRRDYSKHLRRLQKQLKGI